MSSAQFVQAWPNEREIHRGLHAARRGRRSNHPQYLYNIMPGEIRVKLLIIFRDSNGTIHHALSHSADTLIPRADGGVLVELPEVYELDGFVPRDILYSFEMLQI